MNEILIYSAIAAKPGFVSSLGVAEALKAFNGEPVSVRINSVGGSVYEGFAIYNLLKSYAGRVSVYVDGLAASAASIVAMAGAEIIMGEGAQIMIHAPYSTGFTGSPEDLRKEAADLEAVAESYVSVYAARTKKSADEIRALMAAETYMSAADAVAQGFADRVAQVDAGRSGMSFLNTFNHATRVASAFKEAGLEFTAEAAAALIAKSKVAEDTDAKIADIAKQAQADVDAAKAELTQAQAKLAEAEKRATEAAAAADAKIAAEAAKLDERVAAAAAERVAGIGFKGKLPSAGDAGKTSESKNTLTGLERAIAAHKAESSKN